tara:strand:- start:269 stop:703 length:435 start_codon:yes stop_codon:yes gene_type:complete
VAAATLPLVQRTPLDATLGGSQANRAALAPAKRTPGRSELQPTDTQLLGAETVPSRTLAELQGSGSITPGSFTGHQATGTFNSQPILLRSFPKLLGTVQKLLGTVQKLFSSGTECSLVVLGWRFLLGIIRFVGRRRQGSALIGS